MLSKWFDFSARNSSIFNVIIKSIWLEKWVKNEVVQKNITLITNV